MTSFLVDTSVQSLEDICKALAVDPQSGLTEEEVHCRLRTHGRNSLPETPKTPFWRLVLDQFEDIMVRLLLLAALVSYTVSALEGDYWDVVEPGIIILILLLNAIIGVFQENRAAHAIEALKNYIATTAVALRHGKLCSVDAEELVPGDVVEICVGSRVPADIRLTELHSTTLRVDQSILTGESHEVMKSIDAIHRDEEERINEDHRYPMNMVYSGTAVVYGKARGVVVLTGTATEIGSIQRHVQEQEEVKTPLQLKLDEFGILLSKVIGYICLAVFLVNILHWYRNFDSTKAMKQEGFSLYETYGQPIVHSLKVAVALAVAAIPEGLPAVVTTCLALGTRRLSRQNALVRDLGSVETLGRCTVICSDKTGTLTSNMMSVMEVCVADDMQSIRCYHLDDTRYDVRGSVSASGNGVQSMREPFNGDAALKQLAVISVLCNEASLRFNSDKGCTEKIGESTEAALLTMSEKLAIIGTKGEGCSAELERFRTQEKLNWKRVATLEFTRCRKSMSVLCARTQHAGAVEGNTEHILLVKGAPEELLQRSQNVLLGDGSVVTLSPSLRQTFAERIDEMSSEKALRCMCFAFRNVTIEELQSLRLDDPSHFRSIEKGLTLVGSCGMMDPPRPEISDAIHSCRSAGIRIVVITGDKRETAVAVCQQVGLLAAHVEEEQLYSGAEFKALSRQQQIRAVEAAVVFYRTDPSHKMQLVQLLQEELHYICAMTGDGVNDSPALKKADIGVAMGSGTEVAKAASNMILADDNLATVVNAVREGRCIFNNTKQFIRYLISSNIGEVACVLATGLLGLPEALTPIQLLWVNLVTDGLPATALSFNAPDTDIMEQPPRSVDEPIVNNWLFVRYLIIGTYVGLSTVVSFLWWFLSNGYSVEELQNVGNCRAPERCAVLQNPMTARAIALSTLVLVEMWNALNALSENSSLLVTRPTTNVWLMLAIASSIVLHLMIMYIPFLADLFSITPLGVPLDVLEQASSWCVVLPSDFTEWIIILICSLPVILIDEVLKYVTRSSMSLSSRRRDK